MIIRSALRSRALAAHPAVVAVFPHRQHGILKIAVTSLPQSDQSHRIAGLINLVVGRILDPGCPAAFNTFATYIDGASKASTKVLVLILAQLTG